MKGLGRRGQGKPGRGKGKGKGKDKGKGKGSVAGVGSTYANPRSLWTELCVDSSK